MYRAFASGIDEGERMIVHFPWIDDLGGPSGEDLVFTGYLGKDADSPVDPSDDLSGDEPFFVAAAFLDSCGEPLRLVESVRLDRGALSGGRGAYTFPTSGSSAGMVVVELAQFWRRLGGQWLVNLVNTRPWARTLRRLWENHLSFLFRGKYLHVLCRKPCAP